MILMNGGWCWALLVVGSVVAPCFAEPPTEKSTGLPPELQGVWTIVSGEEDGEKLKFARGEHTEIGEWRCNELIVQADRWIVNNNWGEALVYRAKVVTTHPVKQIQVWGDRAETKKGGVLRFIYRINGDELTICMGKDDHPPTEFRAEKGSGQAIWVLKRSN